MPAQPLVSIISLNFPPEPTGIAPYSGALATLLQERGYSVTARVAHPHYPEWKISDGYGRWTQIEDFRGVRVRRHRHYVPRAPRGIRRLLSELSFGVRLVFARWERPSIAIAVSPSLFATALIALRLRLTRGSPPLVIWVQDLYSLGLEETGEGGRSAARLVRWIERQTLRSADRTVVIHPRFADYVIHTLGVDPSKVAVVRNWTHLTATESIDPTTARLALGWPTEVTLAVHTGNMGIKQGLDNIVDAARVADQRSAPTHFVLVGNGGERQKLVEYARGVSRISFVDPLDDDEYRLALAAADVLLVNEKPGISEMAAPSKLTSYFHAGRPVVAATDLDGITASEVRESKAGRVIEAGKPSLLLDTVLEIGSDTEGSALLSRNGRKYRDATLGEDIAIREWIGIITSLSIKPPTQNAHNKIS